MGFPHRSVFFQHAHKGFGKDKEKIKLGCDNCLGQPIFIASNLQSSCKVPEHQNSLLAHAKGCVWA